MFLKFTLVFLGAGLGGSLRYFLSLIFNSPYPTLIANYLGCFGIAAAYKSLTTTSLKLLIITGFLGGLTTFSSFIFEIMDKKFNFPLLLAHLLGGILFFILGNKLVN